MAWWWDLVEFRQPWTWIRFALYTYRAADWEARAFTDMRNNLAVRYLEVTVRGILSELVQAMDQQS
jgi:hypothetical protein